MTRHNEAAGLPGEEQVTLRSPAELADALPYVLGFQPDDSIVMIALHGSRGRFGGRLRLGIPRIPEEWPEVCDQLAECLISGSERRGGRPDGVVLFLCQEPAEGESGEEAMERLRPLAQRLRTACGGLEVPVFEALCISGGRFWSYVCPDRRCCPPEGVPLALPGTSVMAAAATFAGVQVRGSLREMEARLAPLGAPRADGQERALDAAGAELVPRILDGAGSATVCAQTLGLVGRMLDTFQAAPSAADACTADLHDDRLLDDQEAAAVIIGLQDRRTRDRAAGWMEDVDADAALRLWRALARRCVGSYGEHAAAPLTLAGWVAWSAGDELTARVALGRALRVDPDYLFARLLHQACNEGVPAKLLRQCLRREDSDRADRADGADRADRADRAVHAAVHAELERLGDLADAEPLETAGSSAATAEKVGTVETDGPVESAEPDERATRAEAEEPAETEEPADVESAAEVEELAEAEAEGERESAREWPGWAVGPGGKSGPAGAAAPGGRRRPEGRPRARRRTGGRGTRSRR